MQVWLVFKFDRYSPVIYVLHVLNFMFFNAMFQIGYTKIEILVNMITVYRIPLGVSKESKYYKLVSKKNMKSYTFSCTLYHYYYIKERSYSPEPQIYHLISYFCAILRFWSYGVYDSNLQTSGSCGWKSPHNGEPPLCQLCGSFHGRCKNRAATNSRWNIKTCTQTLITHDNA